MYLSKKYTMYFQNTQSNHIVKPCYVILHGMDLLSGYFGFTMFLEIRNTFLTEIHSNLFENTWKLKTQSKYI